MATVKLLNSASWSGDNVNGYSTANSTFTASSLSITLKYSGSLMVRNGIYIGTQHTVLAERQGFSSYKYPLTADYVEVQFISNSGFSEEDLYIFPYPTITYSTEHGTTPSSVQVKTGDDIGAANIPTLSETGYIFDGWYFDSSFTQKVYSSSQVTQTGNFTLYAKWRPITDLSTAKSIAIPEGNVKSISVNGVILWQKQTSRWVTIWEGTKTITNDRGSITGTSSNFAQTVAGTGTTPTLRITFTNISGTGPAQGNISYIKNGSYSSAKPTSPVEFTSGAGSTLTLLGVSGQSGTTNPIDTSITNSVFLQKVNQSTSHIVFSLGGYTHIGSDAGSNTFNTTMTITKIEQYIEN